MDLSAQSSRVDAVLRMDAAHAAGSSAARHDAASPPIQASSGIVEVEFDENKSSRKSSFVAHVDDVVEPKLFGGFFSPGLASVRRRYCLLMARATAMIIVLMWITLPVYWGSIADSASLTGNLEAWFIDRDGSRIGSALVDAVQKYSAEGPQLTWTFMDPDQVGDDDAVQQSIIQERVWVAIVIQPNATTKLSRARSNGDETYDPSTAIKVYYSQARQEIANGNYVVPLTTQLLQTVTTSYATQTAQRYFAQINGNGSPNSTALQLIANAPQTISPAIGWTMVNLRPYTDPAAQALTLVGNIFLCIFSFMITMANSAARQLVAPHMAFRDYIWLRLTVPLIAYVPLSLSYTLVNVAFKLPLGTKFGEGPGVMLSFVFIYMGMAAVGLSIEAMITILSPRFVPFFLFILILYNISPVVLPDELQNRFYAYGAGFPIWNLSQALRTIMFDTNSHLGVNAAVIAAWILLSCATLTLFTWLARRWEARRFARHMRSKSPSLKGDVVDKGKEKIAV